MKKNMWIQPLIDVWMVKAKERYNITLALDDENQSFEEHIHIIDVYETLSNGKKNKIGIFDFGWYIGDQRVRLEFKGNHVYFNQANGLVELFIKVAKQEPYSFICLYNDKIYFTNESVERTYNLETKIFQELSVLYDELKKKYIKIDFRTEYGFETEEVHVFYDYKRENRAFSCISLQEFKNKMKMLQSEKEKQLIPLQEKWNELKNKYHVFFETYPLTCDLFNTWNHPEQNKTDILVQTSSITKEVSLNDIEFSFLMIENLLAKEIIYQHLKKSCLEKEKDLHVTKFHIYYKDKKVTNWEMNRYNVSYQGVYIQIKLFEETYEIEGDMQTVLQELDEIIQRQWNLKRLHVLTK